VTESATRDPARDAPSDRRSRALAVARWLAAVACLAGALLVSWPKTRSEAAGVDYYQFWIVGQARSLLEIPDVYSPAGRDRMAELGRRMADGAVRSSGRLRACADFRSQVETFATPFLYALVGAWATGDYDTDLRRFHFASLAVFVAAVVGFGVLLGYGVDTGIFAAAVLCALSDPFAADVRTGNVGELQLGGLCLFLALRRRLGSRARELAAGAVLGALVAAKPTLGLVPVLVAFALLADRRLRSLGLLAFGSIAAGLTALAVGAAYLGSWHAWLDWLRGLGELELVSDISVSNGNFGLAQLVAEAGGPQVGLPLTFALSLAIATPLWVGRSRGPAVSDGTHRFEREYFALALGSAAAALAPELVWLHYYVLLVPLSLLLLRRGQARWIALPGVLAAIALLGSPARFLAGVANPEVQAPVYVLAGWLSAALGLASAPRAPVERSASVR